MTKKEKAESPSAFTKIKSICYDWRSFAKMNRSQYRVDTKALLCRGLEE